MNLIYTTILLQAAMAAGLILITVFFGFMIISVAVLYNFLFKILNKKIQYGDSVTFKFLIVLVSTIISLGLFYCIILAFDKLYPDFLKYS
jgi:hypothetical protein